MQTTTTSTAASAPVGRAAHEGGFLRGFTWGLRGLLAKELRGRSRGWRPAIVLTGYLLALTGGVVGFLLLADESGLISSPWLGLQLFSALAVAAVLLVAFITPSLTAGAISGELERRTLDLMLVTRASALGVVAGKLVSSLAYVLFLLFASLPAFALIYLFGGIPVQYLVLVLGVAGATAVMHASIGLVLSALIRRTIVASVAGYLIVIGLVFGLPFIATASNVANGPMMDERFAYGYAMPYGPSFGPYGPYGSYVPSPMGASGPPPAYTYASPMVALSSALPAGSLGFGMPLGGELLRMVVGGSEPVGPPGEHLLRPVYLTGMDQETGMPVTEVVWAPWLYYLGLSLLSVPLSVMFAALVLTPRKPWRRLGRRRATST